MYKIIDNFIDEKTVTSINAEWPESMSCVEKKTSIKRHTTILPRSARRFADYMLSDSCIAFLEEITGIQNLLPDPSLFGGGLHEIGMGGFLKMHVDFNRLHNGWYRRVNALIYLNQDWQEEWGGQLLLGEDESISIAPIAGRCVIFDTTADSWHGHPYPLQCHIYRTRRSMAFYYYTEERPSWFTEQRNTVYK